MRKVVTALVLAGVFVAPAWAQQQPSPYDTRFQLRGQPAGGAPLYAEMATGSRVLMTIPSNASGIILRWCRPELNFGVWQFGTLATQRQLLDGAWCEISVQGRIGNVEGKVLDPVR
jgi:hypothetical protein